MCQPCRDALRDMVALIALTIIVSFAALWCAIVVYVVGACLHRKLYGAFWESPCIAGLWRKR